MTCHPSNLELSLYDAKIEQRKTKDGGTEQVVVISPEVVAQSISRMEYSAMGDLINYLSANLDRDGEADSARGRPKTANWLYSVSMHLDDARASIKELWKICRKHMTKVDGGYVGE